jgi:hypothetical protein
MPTIHRCERCGRKISPECTLCWLCWVARHPIRDTWRGHAVVHDRKGNRRGHCTMDFNAGTSEVYDRLQPIPLPCEFEVEWDTVTNGSNVQQIIVDIRPHKTDMKKPIA